MFSKFNKGDIGYLSYQRNYTLLRTLLYFGIVIAIFVIGFVTSKTKNNMLTIVAILGCLPASKSMVNAIMYRRFKPISDDLYNSIKCYEKTGIILYNMPVSSNEKITFIQCIAINDHSVYLLYDNKNNDDAKLTKYIKNHLANNGKGNVNVKCYCDKKSFCSRLNEINKKTTDDDNTTFENKVSELLKVLCL